MVNRRSIRPLFAFQRSVSPCCADVTSSPRGVNSTCASFWPARSGYLRSHDSHPSPHPSRSSLGDLYGDPGAAVATATAMRLESGENARRMKRSGPRRRRYRAARIRCASACEGHLDDLDAHAVRPTVPNATRRPSGENAAACWETGALSRTGPASFQVSEVVKAHDAE